MLYSPAMGKDNEQLTKQSDSPLDLATYYRESAHSAHNLLSKAVFDAAGDYGELSRNLRAVNQYIKARASVGELIEKHVSVEDPSESWDPFSESSLLDGKLDVLEAKTEFVSITTSESAAVALYQAGLTYKEISTNTGLPTKKIRQVVQKQGIQRTRKKSVPVSS